MYRVGFGAEEKPGGLAKYYLDQALLDICITIQELFPNEYDIEGYIAADDHKNFRVDLDPRYKANRKDVAKPKHYNLLREHMFSDKCTVKFIPVSDHETDDEVSIRAHELGLENVIVVHIDKDLDMIPCLHYNFVNKKVYEISEVEALRNFYKQMLTGDRIDNIKGLRGVGKVTASRLIDTLDDEIWMWDRVYIKYKQAHGKDFDETRLIRKGKLLWMKRSRDDDWDAPDRPPHFTRVTETEPSRD